jgi:stress responsive alpha/beta barrel protein
MIKHVVFFKFKPEAGPAERRAVINQLKALPDKIDVIRSFEIGEDIMHSARAWDVVEIATYDDLEALEIYTRHVDHVEVVLQLREVCDAVGSVDFEF